MKVIVAVLTLAVGALAILLGLIHFGKQAQAAEEKCITWHPGAAPFAKTEAEAIQKLSWELRLWVNEKKVTAEEAVLIEKHIRARPEGDVPLATIVKGQRFDWMASGEVKRPLISNLCFDPAYAEKNKDGKPVAYYALVGPQWTVQLPTRTLLVSRPNRCYNWAGTWLPKPVAPPAVVARVPQCVEHVFNAPVGGKVRWGVGTTTGPLPPDECNAQKEGEGAWKAWYGECEVCIPDLDYIKSTLGPAATIPHKFMYPVTQRKQTLRFSTEIWSRIVYVCLEDAVGKQTCGVMYVGPGTGPGDWNRRYLVEVPDASWMWQGDPRCPPPQ